MLRHLPFALLRLALLFALLTSLAAPAAVFADDATPPPPSTEEPVVEPVTAEEPAATQEPVLEPAPTEEPQIEEPVEATIAGVLEAAPQDTSIVVLDDNGEPLPLASEQAAETLLTSDPMWCPAGETPGGPGCTAAYGTVTELIANLGSKSGAGTIFFTSTYSTVDATFNHTNANLLGLTDLTLQGGWNGLNGADYALSGATTFSVNVEILNWLSDVSINDITISNTADTNLRVYTTGDIQIDHVNSSEAGSSYGAYLYTSAGDIVVRDSSFNSNPSDGVRAWPLNGGLILDNVTANENGGRGIQAEAAMPIQISNVTVTGNHLDGMWIWTSGDDDITLSNVTANGNGFSGAALDACIVNYATGECSSTGNVIVVSSTFDDNLSSGLSVQSGGNATLFNVAASGNGAGALLLSSGNSYVTCSQFLDNVEVGVDGFLVNGSFTLNDVSFSGNGMDHAGNPTITSGPCFGGTVAAPVDKGDPGGSLPLRFVNGTSGQPVELICGAYSGTRLLMPDGDWALFPCPLQDGGMLEDFTDQDLPGPISTEYKFVHAMQVGLYELGTARTNLAAGITIGFKLPEGVDGSSLTMLRWDEAGSQWLPVPGGVSDGYFIITVEQPGVFVLVSER